MTYTLPQRLLAEALGTGALVCAVVGSGIMAQGLTTDIALALLGIAIATGAVLVVIITTLAPISGAHFNPAVTFVVLLRREIPPLEGVLYVVIQLAGGIAGTWLAHAMFELPVLELGTTARTGVGQWVGEVVAVFGLVLTVLLGVRFREQAVPTLVALYVVSAIWFTSSTCFANPAVTLARAFTDTLTGIRPIDTLPFFAAELVGAVLGMVAASALLPRAETATENPPVSERPVPSAG